MNSIPPRAGGSTPEIVFSAEVHESCMGIEVDEATAQFVRDNPTLVVRLAKLWGVSQLDKTSLALVHAVEYRLWQELDAMDAETVERVAKEGNVAGDAHNAAHLDFLVVICARPAVVAAPVWRDIR